MTTAWITDQQLKDSSQIQQNVDSYLFTNDIFYAQKSKIESCLTEEMIDRIQAVIDGGVDAPITTLIDDYIVNALALHTFCLALPNIGFRVTNKGIFLKADSTNENGGSVAVEYLRRQYKDRAEFYTNMMLEYIEDNPDLFPEQTGCVDCDQDEGFDFNLDYTGI